MNRGKVKVYVLGKDNVGWSIDKDRNAVIHFLRKGNFEITENILKNSLIFCVWGDLLLNFRYIWVNFIKKVLDKKMIAVITNDITFYPRKVKALHKYVDAFVVPSQKIYQYLERENLEVYRIPFFVDPRIFKTLSNAKEESCRELGIDERIFTNKIVVGSFQRDSFGKNLSEPKWEKNPDLLIRILKGLPKGNFMLLLAGPRRHYIIDQCQENKIPYFFYGNHSYIDEKKDDIAANNLSLEIINKLYNLADIYIVTSRSEGGPKSILESALTKTMIFSTEVGLAPDILHSYLIYNEENIKDLTGKIQKFMKNPQEFQPYIEYNHQRANREMDENLLKEKYRTVISETLRL
jgi:hypothetical protein